MFKHFIRLARWLALLAALVLFATNAEAQVARKVLRFSIETDILSMAGIELKGENGNERDLNTYGIGPNQYGGLTAQLGARIAPTPLAFGFAYGLSSKVLLGLRTGLGVDIIAPDGAEDNTRVLGLSLMPGLTFVPFGQRAKMFLAVSPIFQYGRVKVDEDKTHTLLGGFAFGLGTLVFVARQVSIDIGFHFEGRFGNYEDFDGGDTEVRDLRGLVRLGLSLWK